MHLTRCRPARTLARRLLPLLPLLLLVALVVACNTPQSTTEIAGDYNRDLWGPYRVIFWLAGIVFVVVLGITLVLSIWFRERPGRPAQQLHGHTRLEVVWTLIPVAIVVIMAVPTVNTIVNQAGKPPADALKVEATGHQWWFEFRYPDLNITTANELHIPEGKPVAFTIRSQDVIHAFWVPKLAGKIDMVPGHVNDIHFTALKAQPEPYLGQCAEFCGIGHANMRFRVFVHTPEDFAAWAKRATSDADAPKSDLERQGQQTFLQSACIGCHTIKGTNAQGLVGPNLTHVGARTTIAAGVLENTPENMARWIHNSADIKPGSKMPPMGSSGGAGGALSDEQIKAVVAYLQGLK